MHRVYLSGFGVSHEKFREEEETLLEPREEDAFGHGTWLRHLADSLESFVDIILEEESLDVLRKGVLLCQLVSAM